MDSVGWEGRKSLSGREASTNKGTRGEIEYAPGIISLEFLKCIVGPEEW